MNTRKIIESTIVALIVLNIFELCFFFKVRGESGMYDSQVRFPAASGYSLDGTFMKARKAPCSLIRLSSDNCVYCRMDQHLYERLVGESQKIGCSAILLAPKMGQIKRNETLSQVAQVQFVDMKFGGALNPVITPETILVDGTGRIKWDWEGALDDHALSDGLHALYGFKSRSFLFLIFE